MARTPLFALLRRCFHLFREARRRGSAPAELLAGRAARLSRRQFLHTGSALGLAALTGCRSGPRPDKPARRNAPSVLVVGAGLAGLTCAWRLQHEGVPVRLFEASKRVGGRMHSLREQFADGQVAELGGELIDSGHTAIRNLCAELQLELEDRWLDAPDLAEVWHFGGQSRSVAEVIEAFVPVAARIDADLEELEDGEITYRTPNGAERLDHLSLAEWLEGCGAEPWFRQLLEVGYVIEYGREAAEQSCLNLLWLIETGGKEFRLFGESDERWHIHGGNDRLPTALAGLLSGSIQLQSRLEAVHARPGGGFRCAFNRAGRPVDVEADLVVLTLPFSMLREVKLACELPDVKRRAIAELAYGTNSKLMLGFSERVWRSAHGASGDVLTDLSVQCTWETSRGQPGKAGILTIFTGGARGVAIGEGTAASQAAAAASALDKIFPGAAAAHEGMGEARFHWPSHAFSKGSYSCYGPGQYTSLRGAEGLPVRGLFFAGEHCSLPWQGFMNGACESGEMVALAILASLGALEQR